MTSQTLTQTAATSLTPHHPSTSTSNTNLNIPRGPLTTTLNFYSPPPDGSKPFNYVEAPPPGSPQRNYTDAPQSVTINDIRSREEDFELDKHGFAPVRGVESKVESEGFEDDEIIKRVFYPEVEELLLKRLEGREMPVNRVHIDQTASSAAQRVRFHLPAAEAEEALKERYRIINVWRPLNPLIRAHPLAVADSTSVDDEAMVGIEHRYPDRTGETAAVKWEREQRWWYWSGLGRDERLLLQCFDSQDGARVPHSAFVDPRSEEGVGRESIEVRALVFG
ncbi:MAG: hypothetical protein Q9226_006417 [Calogaya cf. arnoldii]